MLRAQANDERAQLIRQRCRAGEDPWDFVSDLPTIDEFVVLALVADALDSDADHRDADSILRQIAVQMPELRPAVWPLLRTVPVA